MTEMFVNDSIALAVVLAIFVIAVVMIEGL